MRIPSYVVYFPTFLLLSKGERLLLFICKLRILVIQTIAHSFIGSVFFQIHSFIKGTQDNFLLNIFFGILEIFKQTFKTDFWVQNQLLNLCSVAVNSQRLLCGQKLVWNVVLRLSGIQKNVYPFEINATTSNLKLCVNVWKLPIKISYLQLHLHQGPLF